MAKAEPTASKQRKSRSGAKKHEVQVVTQVNERQIAGGGTLAATGEAGADLVNRISDWLQANARVVITVLVLVVAVVVGVLIKNVIEISSHNDIMTKILTAREGEDAKEVREKFKKAGEYVAGKPEYEVEYFYHYSKALWATLLKDAEDSFPKAEDRKEVLERIGQFLEAAKKQPAGQYDLRIKEIETLKRDIESLSKSLEEDARLRGLTTSSFNEKLDEKQKPVIVAAPENPVVTFVTTQGTFSIELYEEALLQNTIDTVMALVQRGYYDGTKPGFVKRPGVTSVTDVLFNDVSLIGFGKKGMLKELPKEEDDKDKKDDKAKDKKKDEKQELAPYFFILPESMTAGDRFSNRRGSVMLYFDPANPHKRGTEFAVNLSDNSRLNGIYQVIGKVTDDAGLRVLENLTTSDVILDASITKKRERDYLPKVIFTEGPSKTGLPQLWTEEEMKLESPRITRVSEPKIVDDKTNPMVVMSTDKGDLLIELFEDNAPNTVANFIHLIEKGHYKGSNFHRVEMGDGGDKGARIVQGGRRNGSEDFDWTIKNEAKEDAYNKLRNRYGTIAMARQTDLNTGGCQFFVNLKDYPDWDKEDSPYCVFGRVVQNLWAAENIRKDDKILDAWVVQKRKHDYIPLVKFTGKTTYEPAVKKE
ncbi:MAG: peptidylprolyl isomerase [Planctomycetaceae bacterium]|nr:peptidylprolyl isomerase [Planctomycetaceae bacterium]